jgi:hypothetical protein
MGHNKQDIVGLAERQINQLIEDDQMRLGSDARIVLSLYWAPAKGYCFRAFTGRHSTVILR